MSSTTTPVAPGDQLETGLTPEQLATNARTWRHIWFVQRFLLETTAAVLAEAGGQQTAGDSTAPAKAPDLVTLLASIASWHDDGHAPALYERLSAELDDPQLAALVNNTRVWLGGAGLPPVQAVIGALHHRCLTHDQSKLVAPEVATFTEMTAKLSQVEYGSDAYKAFLAAMKPALDNHYARNRHHPEHFPDGVAGMTLVDVLEMLCDWAASSLRTLGGDILKSMVIQQKRFDLSDPLVGYLLRTYQQRIGAEYNRDPRALLAQ